MEDVIQRFIQDMIKNAGIDNMPDDFKKTYSEKLAVEAQRRLGIMAIAELDEQGAKDFEEFIAKNQSPEPQKTLEFFNSRISNFETKVQETLTKFAEEFISGAEKLKGTKLS